MIGRTQVHIGVTESGIRNQTAYTWRVVRIQGLFCDQKYATIISTQISNQLGNVPKYTLL